MEQQQILNECLDVQVKSQLDLIPHEESTKEIKRLKKEIEKTDITETIEAFVDKVYQSILDNPLASKDASRGDGTNLGKEDEPRQKLPVRYIPPTIKNHVSLLPIHHNGLIHGAMIRKENYNIFCYAHRWYYHKSERWGKKFRHTKSVYKEEVAGLYEKYNKDGISLGLPVRNVSLFDNIFVNASSPSYLEKQCSTSLWHFGPRKRQHVAMENSWFYLPDDKDGTEHFTINPSNDYTTTDLIHNNLPPSTAEEPVKILHTDSCVPSKFIDNPNFDNMFYGKGNPPPDKWLSKANTVISGEASEGFVVNSPYIKVFSLGPKIPTTIVSILNCTRDCNHKFYKGSGTKNGTSTSKWLTHIIK